MLSRHLEQTLHRALSYANARHHEFATLEHLLLALTEDEDAADVMRGCSVDIGLLRQELTQYIDVELQNLAPPCPESEREEPESEGVEKAPRGILRRLRGAARKSSEEVRNPVSPASEESKPTSSFQRVLQRAAIHVQSSGREEVTGANVLVALFSERESNAVYFLEEREMTRLDAVKYIAHGITKAPGQQESSAVNGEEDAPNAWCTVQLINDDHTPMDFVVQVLEGFFDKGKQEAKQLMLQVHVAGKAICGSYPCALAATKASMVIDYARKSGHPLMCTVAKEG